MSTDIGAGIIPAMSTRSVVLALAAACACLLWGCDHPRPATTKPATLAPMSPATTSSAFGLPVTARPASTQPVSEFWVLAEGWEGTPEHSRPFLRLCPIGDTITICAEHLIEKEDSFVHDPSGLGSGIFHDAPITGTLPDNVWTTADGAGDDCGKILLSRFAHGSWHVVHKFREAWEFAYRDYRLSPWWPGSLLVMFAPFCCEDDRMVFYSFGDGPKRRLPIAKRRNGRRVMETPGEMKAFPDGSVVVSGQTTGRSPIVEVWRGPAGASDVTPAPCGVGIAAVGSPDDFVVYGETKDGAPCAFRREVSAWVDLRVPPRLLENSRGMGRVEAYAREPGGTEWVVVFDAGQDRGPSASELYSRRPEGDWAPVALPPPRYPTKIGVVLRPRQVHAVGDGDVWVVADYKGESDRGVILHNRKPRYICRKEWTVGGDDRPVCEAVGGR